MATLASVSGYGTLATRPAAGVPGRKYWATDTASEYYDDGSTWLEMPNTSPMIPLANLDDDLPLPLG